MIAGANAHARQPCALEKNQVRIDKIDRIRNPNIAESTRWKVSSESISVKCT